MLERGDGGGRLADLGRLWRTLGSLHPTQVVARPVNALLTRLVRGVSAESPPALRVFSATSPAELADMAERERQRGAARIARLPPGLLRDYEQEYGLEAGAGCHPIEPFSRPIAVAPFPASIRARRLAVAARLGARGAAPELARAARAITLHPELHLLGNHLLENAFGLVCAGAVAIGRESDLWWELGRRLLSWQLGEQFLGDGGHFERSASYHVALTYALLETIHLADVGGRGARPAWSRLAEKALGWCAAVRTPDGAFPLFNDAAIDACPGIDDVLRLGAALGLCRASSTTSRVDDEITTDLLPDTGWVLVRTPELCLAMDVGVDGAPYQPGHVHADALTIEVWLGNSRAVADFGVASYDRGPGREATRSTRSHNTVTLGDLDSCEVWGGFRVGRRSKAHLCRLEQSENSVAIEATHDGYSWLPGTPIHHRTARVSRSSIIIDDQVPGSRVPFTSRLRLTEEGIDNLQVSGSQAIVTQAPEVWYPRHGDASPAIVLKQEAGAADSIRWELSPRRAR